MSIDMITVNGKPVHMCWIVGYRCRWKDGERVDHCQVDGGK